MCLRGEMHSMQTLCLKTCCLCNGDSTGIAAQEEFNILKGHVTFNDTPDHLEAKDPYSNSVKIVKGGNPWSLHENSSGIC